MNATKLNSNLDEMAIYRAAAQMRAEHFAALVGKAAAGIKAWVKRHVTNPMHVRAQRQRQLDELNHMDEHMLRDLGLSRGGIAYAFEHGREAEPANVNVPPAKTPRAA
ncbi:MAG: DUF1127 domain-containing protein [Rhodospirillaceae bacterium]|nr:DUF1127 domain-containing protein [Rhodospirillaceae bacterium]